MPFLFCDRFCLPGLSTADGGIYYGTQARQLEYDFVIAPKADPRVIKLGFAGAERVEVDGQGDLLLRLAGKQLRLEKPIVYQERDGVRQVIEGRYTLNNRQEVGFQIGAYDPTHALVIDPIMTYSTFLGGTGEDTGIEIAVNEHGNAFVTGITTSVNFPTEPNGAKFGPGGGGSDAFVTKFSAAGNHLIYSTYLGGQRQHRGRLGREAHLRDRLDGLRQPGGLPHQECRAAAS